jgi:hypothetical protein
MESWRTGRQELFEELTRICNKIDSNVQVGEENVLPIYAYLGANSP